MKQYTFKDGFKCVASTVEDAKAKHKVMADSYFSKLSDKEKSVLIKNGFKINDDYGDSEYAIKRLPNPKNKCIYASINKTTKKGNFEITCYVASYDVNKDEDTKVVYDSFLRQITFSTNTIKEALSKINKYFKLIEEYINLNKNYKKRIKEINDEALSF